MTPGGAVGPYRILEKLGEGGMGEVYKAHDTRLGRDVAVKVLPSGVAIDADRRARFEREAKAVAALSHPNILAIFDFSIYDGVACAVTELLDGETLRTRLAHGALPVRRAIDIAIQIGRGLSAAHDRDIVHRDLKPENVFLLADGQVKILDFGLAKAGGNGPGAGTETVAATDPGVVMGTVGYMAPEQVRAQTIDARADLFALGAILYEMLSGHRAFQRETAAETMTAILKEDPPDLTAGRADLPAALDAIVRHCLERSPAERFQSARDLVFNLRALAHQTGSGPAASLTSATPRMTSRWREATAWALVMVFATGAGILYRLSGAVRAPLVRLQVTAPEQTTWATPLGAPEGSNGGTISPDGTMLAFTAADSTSKSILWVRPIDSFTALPLAGTDGAAFPFWSPDSRFLGFFTTTRLKKIAAEGGAAQTLCEIPSAPRGGSWSEGGVILIGLSGSVLRRTSSNGGPATPLEGVSDQKVGQQWPYFLPDGQHFLFYSPTARAVFVGSLDAPAGKPLVPSDSNAVFAPPGQILFVREGSLLAQGFDVSRLETRGDARPVAERVGWSVAPWNLGAFSASRTGTLTYRPGGGGRTQLVWMDRSGRELGRIGPPGDYLAPALSPDETRVAFTRRDDQPAGDIWTLDLAKQTPLRFTFSPDTDIYPLWTPDGSGIIYSSVREGLLTRQFAANGVTRQLLPATSSLLISTQVARDGRLLYFGDMGTPTGFDIFTMPLAANAQPTVVVQGTLTDAEPAVSPDGRWLAYATTETGGYEVFVQPMPPTGMRWQISTGGGRQPQWRQDGRELFFATNDRKFYAVDLRPGTTFEYDTPQLLFDIPANTISVRNSYVPSRDGKRFLVNRLLDTTVPPINVVVNWTATVEK